MSADAFHEALQEIFREFISVLQTEDDSTLRAFSRTLAPDEQTVDFMRTEGLSYRGIPYEMDKQGLPLDTVSGMYFTAFQELRTQLKYEGSLPNLSLVDSIYYNSDREMARHVPVRGTELPLILTTGADFRIYDMGELILLNGKISLFTKPPTYARTQSFPGE